MDPSRPSSGRAAVARRFLLWFLPVAALVLGSFYAFHRQQAAAELALLRADQSHGVRLMRRSLESLLSGLAADVLVAARSPLLRTWPQRPGETSKAHLAGLFASLLEHHPGYDQARLLDLRGREVVRVERREGRPWRTPETGLQDKSDRYYFVEAIGLDPGQVYLSRLDLNRERGRMERHPKPVLRLAAPVYDAWERRRGLVVINYLAQRLLKDLRAQAQEPGRPLWADHRGRLLMGPEPGALARPGRPGLAESRPAVWRGFLAAETGRFAAPEGWYTFTTVIPPMAAPRAPFWKVATLTPASAVEAAAGRYLGQTAGLAAGVLVLAAAGLWLLAQSQVRRRAAEADALRRAESQELLGRLLGLSLEEEELPRLLGRALAAVLEAPWLGALPRGAIFLADEDGEPRLAACQGLEPEAAAGRGRYRAPFLHAGRRLGEMVLHLPPGGSLSSEEESFVLAAARTLALVIVRRQALQARAESQARLQAVVDTAVEAIITTDAAGVVRSFNRAAERLFGYQAREVIGRDVSLLQPPETAARHREYMRRYLATGQARVIGLGREVTGRRKDGGEFPLYLSLSEVRVGDRLWFTGILRDITELKEYEDRLRRARDRAQATSRELTEKQRRLDEDLQAAAGIQAALLPQRPPRTPAVEMAWRFVPSQHIGGDLFDAFALGEDHLACYLLDVSGHGAPAALVTVSLHQTLDPAGGLVARRGAGGPEPIPPTEVLAALEREYPLERFDKFFTIAYLLLDQGTGELVYSSAGHPPPLLLRNGGGLEPLGAGGPLIGVQAGGFEEGRVRLGPGDLVLVYTDGLLEYPGPGGELFGEQRLRAALERLAGRGLEQVLEGLWARLMEFGGSADPPDDLSLLGLVYRGPA
jgi:sigma-B regulation protein RsbU (phosphoserine phosphatase)